jgi:hypothetical protein
VGFVALEGAEVADGGHSGIVLAVQNPPNELPGVGRQK